MSAFVKSFKHFVLIRKLESIYSTDVSLEISQLKDAYLLKVKPKFTLDLFGCQNKLRVTNKMQVFLAAWINEWFILY